MGFLSRLFGPKEPETFEPLSENEKATISFLGVIRNFNELAKSLKSRNPHVRAFTVGVVRYAGWRNVFDQDGDLYARKIDDRAVQLLIPMLKDKDEEVRKAAAESLESETARADVAGALEEYEASFREQK